MVQLTSTISALLCITLSVESAVSAESCTQAEVGDCKCTFPNKTFIDLKPLNPKNDGKNWRFPYSPKGGFKGFQYAFNPCYSMTNLPTSGAEGISCNNSVICQMHLPKTDQLYYDLGNQSTEAFQVASDGSVTVTYVGSGIGLKTGDRKSTIKLVCDKDGSDASFTVKSVEDVEYEFTLTSKFCCATSGSSGPSLGTILCIVFVVIVVVYLVAGVLFNKFVRGASGVELIPNREFWAALPGLIKEGFQFTAAKIAGCFGRDAQYDQI